MIWIQVWEGRERETAQVLVETADPAIVEVVRRALSMRLNGTQTVRKASSRRLRGEGPEIRTLEARAGE